MKKNGKTLKGIQRHLCKQCGSTKQEEYRNRACLTYAIDRTTKDVVSFSVGRRTKKTLGMVVNTLLLSEAKEIRTDRLSLYLGLIPKEIHHVKQRGINSIERKNLTLRTHLKRLNRRTIAYSKSMAMLLAVVRIYFWC